MNAIRNNDNKSTAKIFMPWSAFYGEFDWLVEIGDSVEIQICGGAKISTMASLSSASSSSSEPPPVVVTSKVGKNCIDIPCILYKDCHYFF
jgi:hypothetical protein